MREKRLDMSWNQLLEPDLLLEGSILTLTPELLRHYNLDGLILDVDETLVPTHSIQISQELQRWIDELRSCVDLWLVSNNLNEARIRKIAQTLQLPYYAGAAKPSRRKLRQVLSAMNLSPGQVAMVGDRLFTDVLAGNRLGMFTILVHPILSPGESPRSYPLRSFEVWFSQVLGASIVSDRKVSSGEPCSKSR